jgi:HSP20 family protein
MNTQITRRRQFEEVDELQNGPTSAPEHAPLHTVFGKDELLTVTEWTPRVRVAENEKGYLIKAELPEFKREDVKVTVKDGVLTLSGERNFEKKEKNKEFQSIERQFSTFVRSFTLPAGTPPEKVAANFKKGVLKILLPKQSGAQSAKTIKVKVR